MYWCSTLNIQSGLTHWGRATHICVSKLTIIASDNGLSPGRRQAIIWNNAAILSIGLLGTNFSGILIEIVTFSFKKMSLKVSSAKWRPFCLGLYVLKKYELILSSCDLTMWIRSCEIWHYICNSLAETSIPINLWEMLHQCDLGILHLRDWQKCL